MSDANKKTIQQHSSLTAVLTPKLVASIGLFMGLSLAAEAFCLSAEPTFEPAVNLGSREQTVSDIDYLQLLQVSRSPFCIFGADSNKEHSISGASAGTSTTQNYKKPYIAENGDCTPNIRGRIARLVNP